MYKIIVMDDRDSVYGFATLGLRPFPLADPVEAGKKIRDLVESGYAVIRITEALTAQVESGTGCFREADPPTIVLIPGVLCSTGERIMAVKKLVEQATGSDVTLNGQWCS